MGEAREKAKLLINRGELNLKELAAALHLTYSTAYYQLYEAKNFSADKELILQNIILKNGFATDGKGECMQLSNLILEFDALIAQSITILSETTRASIADNTIDETERAKLKNVIENLEINAKAEIGKLKKLLDI